jgi:shikimate dehydrogenase
VAPEITAKTALCGIVLHSAGHTRSPLMHNAAYGAMGIDAAYLAFDVAPDALGAAIAGIRALGLAQVAVSIPHKQAVMAYLDEIDDRAQTIGAVNTVTLRDGRLLGSNTDWIGSNRALETETELAGKRAVVLGAGGAARAVVYGLIEAGATVHVLNRTVERAESLAKDLSAQGAGVLDDLAKLPHDILINTTSVGSRSRETPVSAEQLRADSVVMDIVYDPEETRLLEDARKCGAVPIAGKWMLVYQAAEQLRIWTGRDAPIDVLEKAFSSTPGN